jgi:hypothetical protein
MVVIKKIDTPQDIYVVGINFTDYSSTFGITDDEHLLCVTNDKEKRYINTSGYVSILTKEEFIASKTKLWEGDEENDNNEGFILKDFSGEFKVKVITQSGKDTLPTYDPKEYMMYQMERIEGDDVDDYVLEIPSGFKIETKTIQELYSE